MLGLWMVLAKQFTPHFVLWCSAGRPATEVLLDGLSTLADVSDHMLATFDAAVAAHAEK